MLRTFRFTDREGRCALRVDVHSEGFPQVRVVMSFPAGHRDTVSGKRGWIACFAPCQLSISSEGREGGRAGVGLTAAGGRYVGPWTVRVRRLDK